MLLRFASIRALLLLLWAFFAAGEGLHAQSARVERAHKLYESLAFHEAIVAYEAALEHDDDLLASVRLADCYRLTSQSAGAERWYGKVVGTGMAEPIQQLYYAQALLRNGKIPEARAQFEAYALRVPDDARGRHGVDACDRWEALSTGGIPCRIQNLNINTSRAEFGPAMLGQSLVFSSDRDSSLAMERSHLWTGREFLNLYLSRGGAGGVLGEPARLPGNVNGPFHDGPVSLDSAATVMYFTRNAFRERKVGQASRASSEGIVKLSLHRAVRKGSGDEWQLDNWTFAYNNDEYSTGHPALSQDGQTLIFASDRPGGMGGVDLYRCQLQPDGSWAQPENLGPAINTPGDELFPFLHPSGDLLFASDGLPGLGGLDQFLAEAADGAWAEPRNLGSPLNTYSDDFAAVFNAAWTRGYLSSDRPGGKGSDDLYAVELSEPQIRIRLRDALTSEWLEAVPLEWLEAGNLLAERNTGPGGELLLDLPRGRQFTLKSELPDYRPLELAAPVSDLLSPPVVDWVVDLEPMPRLGLVSQAIDRDTRQDLPGAAVVLNNLTTGESLPLQARPDGLYRIPLEPGYSYQLRGDLDGYLGDEKRFSTEGEEGPREFYEVLELTRLDDGVVIELSNIYYDYDKWYIRKDAAPDLMRLAELMKRYPSMRIELSSHTDARASDAYNLQLSQRRAEAAVAYLVAQGIDRERMVPVGYGENKPRNRCVDDVPCSEREHQYNRRTEFRVLNFNRSILSKDKEVIPVNTYQPTDPGYLKNFLEQELVNINLEAGSSEAGTGAAGSRTTTRVRDAAGGPIGRPLDPALPGGGSQEVWFQSGKAWAVHLGSGTLASASRFDMYKDLGQIQFETWQGGRYLFVLGYFTSKAEADEALKAVLRRGLNEAYIVVYKDGERQN